MTYNRVLTIFILKLGEFFVILRVMISLFTSYYTWDALGLHFVSAFSFSRSVTLECGRVFIVLTFRHRFFINLSYLPHVMGFLSQLSWYTCDALGLDFISAFSDYVFFGKWYFYQVFTVLTLRLVDFFYNWPCKSLVMGFPSQLCYHTRGVLGLHFISVF